MPTHNHCSLWTARNDSVTQVRMPAVMVEIHASHLLQSLATRTLGSTPPHLPVIQVPTVRGYMTPPEHPHQPSTKAHTTCDYAIQLAYVTH
jgi:hypothetical protein